MKVYAIMPYGGKDEKKIVTVQNPLFTAGQSQHFRQKQQSMPHRR